MPPPVRSPESSSGDNRRLFSLLLALCTVLVCAICWQWPGLMDVPGISRGPDWFLDLRAVIAAIVAYRHGIDPYGAGSFGGQHFYSHWWFWFSGTGVTLADSRWLGLLVAGSAVVATWLVARPRNARELGWTLMVFCSAPVILGLNRANVDLAFFALLSLAVPALESRIRFWRIAGVPLLIALATGLKYYPAVGGLLLLALRPGRDRPWSVALGTGLLALTLLSVTPDMSHYAQAPRAEGSYTFGAETLFRRTGLPLSLALGGTVGLLGLGGLVIARSRALRTWTVPATLRTEYLNFILGAVILTACFVLTVNYAYRWIFSLWMMPFICRLQPAPDQRGLRWLRALMLVLLATVLWTEAATLSVIYLAQPAWATGRCWLEATEIVMLAALWPLFACFSGWLVHFVVTQWRAAPEAAG